VQELEHVQVKVDDQELVRSKKVKYGKPQSTTGAHDDTGSIENNNDDIMHP